MDSQAARSGGRARSPVGEFRSILRVHGRVLEPSFTIETNQPTNHRCQKRVAWASRPSDFGIRTDTLPLREGPARELHTWGAYHPIPNREIHVYIQHWERPGETGQQQIREEAWEDRDDGLGEHNQ